ncbi:hypothetical protein [Kordia sp.]|uniref:hypothetical protein n=1 Tax=Kordia sp. TaxID=1965332 RepID=UPI003D2CD083
MIQSPLATYEEFSTQGNKSIPEYIKFEVIKALSFFPELQNTHIIFQLSNKTEKSIMKTRVSLTSLFLNVSKRTYVVVISNNFHLQDKKIEMSYIPKDVLVGWIGVELGKILAYETASNYQVLSYLFSSHFSKKFVKKKELKANRCARRRMKAFVVAARKFILNKSDLPNQVIEKVNKMYTSPAFIVNFINTHSSV